MKDLHIKHRRLKVRDDCTVLVDGSSSSQFSVLFLLVDNPTTHSMLVIALYSLRTIPQCLPVSIDSDQFASPHCFVQCPPF